MKYIKYVIVFLFSLLTISQVYAFDNTQKVYDYAQVLTSKEEKKLKNDISKYIKKYNMDMTIVTVRYHEDKTTSSYAKNFYKYNNFGFSDDKIGIICVIDFSMDKEIVSIETFGKASTIYDNIKTKEILKSINKKEHSTTYDKFSTFIISSRTLASAKLGIKDSASSFSIIFIFIAFIVSIIISIIFIFILLLKNKKYKYEKYKYVYLKKNSMEIINRSDEFLTTKTISKRIKEKL